jgi:hypothetical protein
LPEGHCPFLSRRKQPQLFVFPRRTLHQKTLVITPQSQRQRSFMLPLWYSRAIIVSRVS